MLRQPLPRLSTRLWVINTALAAALAWFLGMSPSTFHDSWSRWPVPVQLEVAAGLGLVLLCSIGVAQWLELRRHLPRPGRWVAATAAGWCIGLLAFFMVASPLWHPDQHPALIAVIGALGGLAMAVTMATTTGLALTRLVRQGLPHNVS